MIKAEPHQRQKSPHPTKLEPKPREEGGRRSIRENQRDGVLTVCRLMMAGSLQSEPRVPSSANTKRDSRRQADAVMQPLSLQDVPTHINRGLFGGSVCA